ncbi:MAG: AAA domain-containing protein [Bacteroidia bacterium]|nr:AAA domain-containing protein [Bacteroidia bacterium]
MRPILHTYKLRLTNLSQGNRSLCLPRLSPRRDIDLRDLGFLNGLSPEDLLQRVLAGKDLALIDRPDPRHAATNLADRRLNQIYRSASSLFEESGSYDLYLGYPFVEGRFLDGSLVRCPVLLFPVRLLRNLQSRPRWQLEIPKDQPVAFNRTFFLAYEQFQGVRLHPDFWEEEIDASSDWLGWLNQLYARIKQYDLEVNFNPRLFDRSLEACPDYLKSALEAMQPGVLTFRPQAVLGMFPQSDSALLQDYELLERNPDSFPLEAWIGGAAASPQEPPHARMKEEDRYLVTQTDASQEAALLRARQGGSLVLYGPPGTGKSQVIVNLVAQALAHGRKVLVVSQKRAALDVVHKRLEALGLDRFSVLVHDHRHDRPAIYDRLRRELEDIEGIRESVRDFNITSREHAYKLYTHEADQLGRTFDELHRALTSREPFGLSAHELYLRTDPAQRVLPVSEAAGQLDAARLEAFLQRLRAVWDYREYFDRSYVWYRRKSFAHYQRTELEELKQQLEMLPATLAELRNTYLRLQEPLGTRLTEEVLNRERIAVFRLADRYLQDPPVREGIEALQLDGEKPPAVRETLKRFSQSLEALSRCQYLGDEDWKWADSLSRHTAMYQQYMHSPLRWLSLGFLRARWFLRNILSRSGAALTAETAGILAAEVQVFSRLQRLYGKLHETAFWGDFPLLAPLRDKQQWLAAKQQAAHAWESLKGITYFKSIRPRFTGGKLEMQAWQRSMQWIGELERFTADLQAHEIRWAEWLHADQLAWLRAAVREPEGPEIAALRTAFLADAEELCRLDSLLDSCTAAERDLIDAVQPLLEEEIAEAELIIRVRNSVQVHWIARLEQTHPVLAQVSSRAWRRQGSLFAEKLEAARALAPEIIARRVQERMLAHGEYNRLNNPVNYREILHQVSKKRRVWTLRKLVQETWSRGLREAAPLWLASPESVAAVFPMQPDLFDLVIFDEASQCFAERAIPVLMRARQAIIAGDDKQLPPLDLYRVRRDDDEASWLEDAPALEAASLLELARARCEPVHLNWHYRSRYAPLIHFSNMHFYEGRLQMAPLAAADPEDQPPIRWVQVQGVWEQHSNRPEAEQVASLVLELARKPGQPSLGVVTFNYHQQELIRDVLEARLESLAVSDPAAYAQVQQSLSRRTGTDDQSLFIKNIENVQGDERDIILFSIGYAPDAAGRLQAQFGLLNLAGGENRLNVAITRARRGCIVVCSFQPHQLAVDHLAHAGPRLLRDYLMYAQRTSQGFLPEQAAAGTALLRPEPNPLAEAVAARLEAAGYAVERAVGATRYRLDLAVRDPQTERYLLGIECEGSLYFGGVSSKEREVYRRQLLERNGWRLHRVWARNWHLHADAEIEAILKLLREPA